MGSEMCIRDRWQSKLSQRHSAYEHVLQTAHERLAKDVEAVGGTLALIGESGKVVASALLESSKLARNAMTEIVSGAETSQQAITAVRQTLDGVANAAQELTRVAASAVAGIEASATALRNTTEQLSREVQESAAAVTTVHKNLVEMTQSLAKELG